MLCEQGAHNRGERSERGEKRAEGVLDVAVVRVSVESAFKLPAHLQRESKLLLLDQINVFPIVYLAAIDIGLSKEILRIACGA
jgi:hypothetical protein